jgi:hypothetical protein
MPSPGKASYPPKKVDLSKDKGWLEQTGAKIVPSCKQQQCKIMSNNKKYWTITSTNGKRQLSYNKRLNRLSH